MAPKKDQHLSMVRVLRQWRQDIFADRSEGQPWRPQSMRTVLEQRLEAATPRSGVDAPALRRRARSEVMRMSALFTHPWIAATFPVGKKAELPDSRWSVPYAGGPLWAAPDLVLDGPSPSVVLLRASPAPRPVLDLEAALSVAWLLHAHGRPHDVVNVMEHHRSGWLHHLVVVDKALLRDARALLAFDRHAIRSLRRREGPAPLTEDKRHCTTCPHAVGCPIEGLLTGSS